MKAIDETLSRCTNFFGPIADKEKQRIKTYLTKPTSKKWDDIHGILISGQPIITIWQAWIKFDLAAPRVGPSEDIQGHRPGNWVRIPDSFTLYRAIRSVVLNK